MNDIDIIRQIKQDNFTNFGELADRHAGVCLEVGKRYIPMASGVLTVQDLKVLKDEIILEAAKTFNEDYTKFVTWVGCQAKYFCLNTINSYQVKDTVSLEDVQIAEVVEFPDFSRENNLEWVKLAVQEVEDPQMKEVIERRYFGPELGLVPFNVIAKFMDLSTQRVHQIHEKFLKLIRAKLSREDARLALV